MCNQIEQVNSFPVIASVLSPTALAMEISQQYPIGEVIDCTLLRAYVNDGYMLKTQSGKYIIKVYRANWRTESEIRYELEFLFHLHKNGVGVSLPIHKTDGSLIHPVVAPEGQRYIVLYHFADGEKPSPPFSDKQYIHLGKELAKLHKASRTFHTKYQRFELNIQYLLDKPLDAIRPFLQEDIGNLTFLEKLSNTVREHISCLESKGLSKAICHGDVSMDNLHYANNGQITFYDFDSGGPGWSSYDLLGVYMFTKYDKRQSRWDAHVKGYQEVMKLNECDIEALPYLHVMNSIWALGCDATIWAQTSGLWRISKEHLDNRINSLKNWVETEIDR
nr:phosphotransferase [Paenibacillus bovis]